MKKYKLLNTKGLLMGLGAATAIIAPVTTLVACGTGNSKKTINISDSQKANENARIQNMMLSGMKGYTLNSKDISELVFNSASTGIIPVTRVDSSAVSAFNSSMAKSSSPVLEVAITKKDINANGNKVDDVAKQIDAFIKSHPGKYIGKVIENHVDGHLGTALTQENNLGEWKIQLFEKADSDQQVASAVSILSDKNKMNIDINQLRTLGGTYLMGLRNHNFGPNASKTDLFATTYTPKGQYNDRVEEDHLKSWTAFSPVTTISQSDMDSMKDTITNAYYEQDRKTHIYNLVMTIATKGSVETIYIPVPEATSFATNANDNKTIQNLLTKEFTFDYFNNVLKGLHSNELDLSDGAKLHVINLISQVMPIMDAAKRYISDDSFFADLKQFSIANHQSLNFDFVQEALKNFSGKQLESPAVFGAKTYSLMISIEEFYGVLREFMSLNNSSGKYDSVLKPSITNLSVDKATSDKLIDELLAKASSEEKQVISYNHLTKDLNKSWQFKYVVDSYRDAHSKLPSRFDIKIFENVDLLSYVLSNTDTSTPSISDELLNRLQFNILKLKHPSETTQVLTNLGIVESDAPSKLTEITMEVSKIVNASMIKEIQDELDKTPMAADGSNAKGVIGGLFTHAANVLSSRGYTNQDGSVIAPLDIQQAMMMLDSSGNDVTSNPASILDPQASMIIKLNHFNESDGTQPVVSDILKLKIKF